MYVFIDETGSFQVPSGPNQVSCVAALLVPESLAKTLFRRVRRRIGWWRVDGREIKGSQLKEREMAEIIRVVRRFDVLLIGVAIDMGLHTKAGISLHRRQQSETIRASLTSTMKAELRGWIEGLARRIDALSNQLYVQSVLLTTLVQAVIEIGTLYYAQRIPRTLGAFSWRLDAKDATPTNYERLWSDVVGPFLQTRSLSSPLLQMRGADYSAFERFCGESSEPPAHLRPRVSNSAEPFQYVEMNALLADLKFCRSHLLTGLQIVDMLAAAIRRACNGTLQPAGWKELGRLMPKPKRGANSVRLLALQDLEDRALPYAQVLKTWDREARRVIV
jgi:hypothetical protein